MFVFCNYLSHPPTPSSTLIIRSLKQSLEEEQAKSTKDIAEYEERLSGYVNKEKSLKDDILAKDTTIATLTKEKDANMNQVEVLKLEIEVLESKVNDAQQLEVSNADLQKKLDSAASEFEEEMSMMKTQFANTQEKITSLEEELESKQKVVSSTEKKLEDTRAKLTSVQGQYDKEAAAVQKLQDELEVLTSKLADVEEAAQRNAVSKEQDAGARKQIQSTFQISLAL